MPKQPLLIAVDLDGTLLTSRKQISPKTKHALQQAASQGHYVVISTGRPFRSSKAYYDQLNLDTPIVNFNGALVHHPHDPRWGLFHTPLDLDVAQDVLRTAEKFGVKNIMIEVMDEVYLKEHDEVIMQTFFDPPVDVNTLPQVIHTKPTSVLIHPYEHHVDQLRQYLSDHHAEVVDHRQWAAPWHVIEIIRAGINKAVGLEKVCHSLNIPPENVIAFGDEDNDVEMLQFAGCGVAMGNAIKQIKEVADVVTLDNDNDGIARFLAKYVLV
ncbi:Cof-like hydrolase [Caldalkalibacillus thermarum TA2.A1]|uniref:Cof-like hydrolase n=1 Tax=Caldalkalibacillus thermarum (strain TA2.A1) TaxID=986075 RepID=F5L933_CALTT|nr:Cof-type HAD-IIB family hydrolase [Caldalkalibacillus thermarum]EGL82107.1 Cof-like hydrolase [Caldalkalibacillus thermarum TA2.A1]QZT34937.1 Cof-type HAD-IIB family hydrolase [Caldalkalibacillus thermarum TA2.A1]GGK11426.1 5-amino-6-(5-phospho-D-ribitylamino)uracil phosphatase YitU [Caldalkalibacillus thermarum]